MLRVAIVILANAEDGEDRGRMVNALTAAKELQEAGDEVQVIFDGAGARWPPVLEKPDHRYHALYAAVRGRVAGVCAFCAGRFQVTQEVQGVGVRLLDEYEGHPSFRRLLAEGWQVLTF